MILTRFKHLLINKMIHEQVLHVIESSIERILSLVLPGKTPGRWKSSFKNLSRTNQFCCYSECLSA